METYEIEVSGLSFRLTFYDPQYRPTRNGRGQECFIRYRAIASLQSREIASRGKLIYRTRPKFPTQIRNTRTRIKKDLAAILRKGNL